MPEDASRRQRRVDGRADSVVDVVEIRHEPPEHRRFGARPVVDPRRQLSGGMPVVVDTDERVPRRGNGNGVGGRTACQRLVDNRVGRERNVLHVGPTKGADTRLLAGDLAHRLAVVVEAQRFGKARPEVEGENDRHPRGLVHAPGRNGRPTYAEDRSSRSIAAIWPARTWCSTKICACGTVPSAGMPTSAWTRASVVINELHVRCAPTPRRT